MVNKWRRMKGILKIAFVSKVFMYLELWNKSKRN